MADLLLFCCKTIANYYLKKAWKKNRKCVKLMEIEHTRFFHEFFLLEENKWERQIKEKNWEMPSIREQMALTKRDILIALEKEKRVWQNNHRGGKKTERENL